MARVKFSQPERLPH